MVKKKIPFRIKESFYAERKQRSKTGTLSFTYLYSMIPSFISYHRHMITSPTPKLLDDNI